MKSIRVQPGDYIVMKLILLKKTTAVKKTTKYRCFSPGQTRFSGRLGEYIKTL